MQFDVVVLGGGPGGYEAAIRCAQYGLKTALIEADQLGGTCLNRGCVPTKALLYSAELYEKMLHAGEFGISAGPVGFDFELMARRKNTLVGAVRSGVENLEKANGVALIRGFGRLTSPHHIEVGEQTVSADHIILATGSFPAVPPIPGADGPRVLNSSQVLSLTATPASLIIVGGGVIGIEFATLFAALGVPVTILELLPAILPCLDPDPARILTTVLRKKGVRIITGAQVTEIVSGECATVRYLLNNEEQSVSAEYCAVCAGRNPATANLGLERLGIEMCRGFVTVDDHLRTNIPGIYAVGDVTGKIQLAHVASAQGLVAAAGCAGREKTMCYDVVPSCIYTSPEIAFVGKNARQLTEESTAFKTGSYYVTGNAKAMVMGEANGIVKLYSDCLSGKILGAQIMAPRATDLIAEVAAVMRCGGTLEQLADTIHPHPTVSEALLEAAHDTDGLCCHSIPRCRAGR